jgi:serine O-acetyltransferase
MSLSFSIFYCFAMSASVRDTTSALWLAIRERASQSALTEPMLASFLHATILNHDCLEDSISYHLAGKLSASTLSAMQMREIMQEAMRQDGTILEAICADIRAVQERDPAV